MSGASSHTITDIKSPVIKATTALGAAGAANTSFAENIATGVATAAAEKMHNPEIFWAIMGLPWGTIAQMAAAFYSIMLCIEWLWKKIFKNVFIYFGWVKPERKLTVTQWAELSARESQRDNG